MLMVTPPKPLPISGLTAFKIPVCCYADLHKKVPEISFIVPRLFEEKRSDIVFGFPWCVMRGSGFVVGTLSL